MVLRLVNWLTPPSIQREEASGLVKIDHMTRVRGAVCDWKIPSANASWTLVSGRETRLPPLIHFGRRQRFQLRSLEGQGGQIINKSQWWRRRESNPRPKMSLVKSLHA